MKLRLIQEIEQQNFWLNNLIPIFSLTNWMPQHVGGRNELSTHPSAFR